MEFSICTQQMPDTQQNLFFAGEIMESEIELLYVFGIGMLDLIFVTVAGADTDNLIKI